MAENRSSKEPQEPLGIIACVTAGFEVVARRPALVLAPLLMDLFLWLGPRLSLAPLLQSLLRPEIRRLFLQGGANGGQAYLSFQQMVQDLAARYNLFFLLEPPPLLGVPGLMPGTMPAGWPLEGMRPEFPIYSGLLLPFLGLMLVGVGLGLNALYLYDIGVALAAESDDKSLPGPISVWYVWGKLVQFTFVMATLGVGALLVVSFLTTFLALIHPLVALYALMLALSMLMLTGFHLVFVFPAMILLRRPLLQAIRESVLLARGDFVGSITLITLALVIWQGLNVVWQMADPQTWTLLVGIIGHACVSTSLVIAIFIFYRERLEFLKTLEKLIATQDAPHPVAGE